MNETIPARAPQDIERRYRDLFENNPLPMWVYDVETLQFLAVNDAAVRCYGWSREEFLAMSLKDIRPIEKVPQLLAIVGSMRDDWRASGEFQHMRRDRQVIDVSITSHALNWDGRPARMVVAIDVSRQKRAERTVSDSEGRYRQMFEQNGAVQLLIDANTGQIVDANPAAVEFYGYTRDEITRMQISAINTLPTAEIVKEMERARTSRRPVFVFPHRLASGEVREVEVRSSAILVGGRTLLYSIVHDITDQRRAERALARSEEQLRNSQKMEAVGLLAGGVAHDFNNLLTVILGYGESVLRELEPGEPLDANGVKQVRDDIQQVARAADRAARITQQLLAFGRKQILQPRELEINEVVRELESMLRHIVREDIALRIDLGDGLPAVHADPTQLEQVVLNLAVNARDAMPEGGVLSIETRLVRLDGIVMQDASTATGDYVTLAVGDTGVGMDRDTRARIFEPFFTTKDVGKGTGLGLSTVYGIVRQSNGHIWVDSVPGNGTTFKIFLPASADAGRPGDDGDRSRCPNGSERILFVEDEPTVRELIALELRSYGYQVLTASSGNEALHALSANGEIAMLITDVVMPGMSGRDLVTAVRRRCPALPVLYVSGYTRDAIAHRGALEPGTELLEKPFTGEMLARRVRAMLDGIRVGELES